MIVHKLSDGTILHIVTSYNYPPIPIRDFDWSAVDRRTYEGEGCKIGHGNTEEAAINDLIMAYEDDI